MVFILFLEIAQTEQRMEEKVNLYDKFRMLTGSRFNANVLYVCKLIVLNAHDA